MVLLDKKIQKVDQEVKGSIRAELHALKADLKLKTYNEETLRIWKNFNNYAEYNDLKDLYSKTLPELRNFEDKLITLSNDYAKTQTIVA